MTATKMSKQEKTEAARQTLRELRDAKAAVKAADEKAREIQAELIQAMESLKLDSLSVEHEKLRIKGTLVKAEMIWINEQRLRKSLGAKLFNRFTKRVLDEAKLEHGIAEGEVDPKVVAACTESKSKAPYVKVTTT